MKNLYTFIFSPTGGTEKVANLIVKALDLPNTFVDLTSPIESKINIEKDDIAIFVFPSFGGRCPELAIKRLEQIKGNNTKAILCATFGNRAFDDTLLELKDETKKLGFIPIAALAISTKHSIFPMIATSRPDLDDEKWINETIEKIKVKLESGNDSLEVPGNYPYKTLNPNPLKPLVDESKCTHCGSCAVSCPALAIDKAKPDTTDYAICISCMRCLNVCKAKARYLDNEKYNAIYSKLLPALEGKKENQLFL